MVVVGSLESPSPDTFQSGTGPIFGWVCRTDHGEIERVEIEIDGQRYIATYGMIPSLLSTEACEGTHNGFSLSFNWNQLGDGEHTVVALADGVEFDRATVTVTVVIETVVGSLENPGPASFQSGIGPIWGWVCRTGNGEIERVEIEIDGQRLRAAYGTELLSTIEACEDTNNAFSVLFNWSLLGDGGHTVVALADGVEFGRATVTVTTLGEGFVRGVAGECRLADFPQLGLTTTLVWQRSSQNFVIASGAAPVGINGTSGAVVGYMENPSPNSFQSGIGVISGWACEAEVVEIVIETADGRTISQEAAYGTERADTEAMCGDTDNGFGFLVNWNQIGDGVHTVVAYVDDMELGRATVRVTTLGEEFLEDTAGSCVVGDFPSPGETVTLEWLETIQNFVITDVR